MTPNHKKQIEAAAEEVTSTNTDMQTKINQQDNFKAGAQAYHDILLKDAGEMMNINPFIAKWIENTGQPPSYECVVEHVHQQSCALIAARDARIKYLEKSDRALTAIDEHIRKLRAVGIIDMPTMIQALKVISDSLAEKESGRE